GAHMQQICRDTAGQPLVGKPADFLGGGSDPDGMVAYQGCGEFNPIFVPSSKQEKAGNSPNHQNQRDFTNAPNRRVTLFFIAPGAEVVLDQWPCPLAKDGPAGCTKR